MLILLQGGDGSPCFGSRLLQASGQAGVSVEKAQRALREEIKPIDDIRSTSEYRLRVACNLLARSWRETS